MPCSTRSGVILYIQQRHTEMENMREEDGFHWAGGEKGRRKGETGPRQTSEGKQKLMKQDVTIDGSLHPSKHGTLAGPALTPLSFSLFLTPSPTRNYKICYRLCFSLLRWRLLGDYPHGTTNHRSSVSQQS